MTSLTDLEKRAFGLVSYGERLNPVRDWLILLLVAAALLVVSAVMNVFMYIGVRNAPSHTPMVSDQPAIDAKSVAAVEAIFQKRAAEEGNYEHVYQFVDPSK